MPGPADKPFAQAKLSTIFLRVPTGDWEMVSLGYKREFRSAPDACTQVWNVKCPTPVCCYAVAGPPERRTHRGPKLMVLTETRREMLGAISPESLALEGFNRMAEFRRYYMARTKRPFRPLDEVQVYTLRPFDADDYTDQGVRLLERLYGDWL